MTTFADIFSVNTYTGGDDTIYMLDGDDTVDANKAAATQTVYGGEGADNIAKTNGGVAIFYGGGGDDKIGGSADSGHLYGDEGNDVLKGYAGADQLYGGADNDGMAGFEGDDLMEGGDGDDQLFGGEGNDRMDGGAGNDRVQGDAGRDLQWGGDGSDTFIFDLVTDSHKGSIDVLKDFARNEHDIIDLFDIDAKEAKNGNQHFKFIGDNDFSDKAGELRFFNHKLMGDTDGDGTADLIIRVASVDTLLASDLVL